jgi:arabinose-5-phosphate isomerase
MRIHAASNAAVDTGGSSISVLDPLARDARETFKQQAAALAALGARIDGAFGAAVRLLYDTEGHVIVTGIGKSGLIGQKIAATFASTGTPSFFLHAAEAFHGDLGMVTEHDTVILLSYSGETEEVTRLLPHLQARGVPTIALAGTASSRLATGADIFLDVGVDREVCPNNLAPTSSTLAQLAMGDALAVALIRVRGFEAPDFARLHPGGSLGRKLTARVRDAMITEMPVVERAASAKECVLALARARCPFVLVQHDDELCGIVGEPEIRRALESSDACLDTPVASIMNAEPAVIEAGALIGVAERRMERERVDALVVVDLQGQVCGVLPRSELG